ncbi:YceI family protein [Streptomyces thinghirensis]|nr:YceI family protein [Streptomyces thinghirensis]
MSTQIEVPGYITGTWAIDPSHSDVSFTVRHLGVSKVRGRFDGVEGEIVTAEDPRESSVSVTIEAASVNTNNRDAGRGGPGRRFPGRREVPDAHLPFHRTARRGRRHRADRRADRA